MLISFSLLQANCRGTHTIILNKLFYTIINYFYKLGMSNILIVCGTILYKSPIKYDESLHLCHSLRAAVCKAAYLFSG